MVVDTVVLIDHLAGVAAATRFLAAVGESVCITPITRAEVLAGVPPTLGARTMMLLDRYRCLTFDAPLADLAGRLCREHRWKLPDALQAASAIHHGLKLATRNTKDFPPERFEFIHLPYVLAGGDRAAP